MLAVGADETARSALFSDEVLAQLEYNIARTVAAGEKVVIYGTGLMTFNLINALSANTQDLLFGAADNLLLVNSAPEEEGYVVLLPNGQYHPIHYAGNVLTRQHLSYLILGVSGLTFEQEIIAYVQRLGCTYDLLFSAVRHTVKPSLRAALGAQRVSVCF